MFTKTLDAPNQKLSEGEIFSGIASVAQPLSSVVDTPLSSQAPGAQSQPASVAEPVQVRPETAPTAMAEAPKVEPNKPKKPFIKFGLIGLAGLLLVGIVLLVIGFIRLNPQKVDVSNLTSRSATISWLTSSDQYGVVVVAKASSGFPITFGVLNSQKYFDDRDYSEAERANATGENKAIVDVLGMDAYSSHHVTVRALEPDTEYTYWVGDGGLFTNAGTFKTDKEFDTTNVSIPIPSYGGVYVKVDEENVSNLIDGAVVLRIKEKVSGAVSEKLSSSLNASGNWNIDVSNARTEDGKVFYNNFASNEAYDLVYELEF